MIKMRTVAALFCAASIAALTSCKKEQASSESESTIITKTSKKKASTYLDTVYVQNIGSVYVGPSDFYDQIRVSHSNHNFDLFNVRVTGFTASGESLPGGSGPLLNSNGNYYDFDLQAYFMSLGSRHANTGNYIESFTMKITSVADANGNDITDQVMIIPANGVPANIRGNVNHIEPDKCPTCNGYPSNP